MGFRDVASWGTVTHEEETVICLLSEEEIDGTHWKTMIDGSAVEPA